VKADDGEEPPAEDGAQEKK